MGSDPLKTLFCFWLVIVAQEAWSQVYDFERFGVEEGLSSSFVTDLAFDDLGYLWVTTWGGGVARFDGAVFEDVHLCSSSRYFSSLLSEDRTIWIGGIKELVRWNPRSGVCKVVSLKSDVTDMALGFDSTLLVATKQGILAIDNDKMSVSRELLKGIEVSSLVQSGDVLYAGTHQGLFKVNGESWRATIVDTTLSVVSAVAMDLKDNLWEVGPQGAKTLGAISAISPSPGGIPVDPTFITAGSLGSLFIGTRSEGIFIWQSLDSSWQQIDESQLGFDHVEEMVFDDWGNAWIATFGGGLIRYGAKLLRWYSQETGLQGSFVRQLSPNSESGINVLYNNGKQDRIDKGQIVSFEQEWAANQKHSALSVSGNFGKWIASEKGLLKFCQEAVYLVQTDTGWQQPISSFVEMDSNMIILCTDDGMWQVTTIEPEVDSSALIFQIKRIYPGQLKHLFLDQFSNIWSWGPENLIYVADSIYEINLSFRDMRIQPTTIAETMRGEIVIGSSEAGLFLIDSRGGRRILQPLQGENDLPNKQIRAILIDGDQMWIGTNDGIAVGKIHSGPVFHLDTWLDRTSGLKNSEINEHAGIVAENQHIYFGTSSGLLEFYPNTGSTIVYGPRLGVESIHINNEETEWTHDQTLRLTGDHPHVSIVLNAVDLGLPLGIRYYWRLKGHDAEWRLSSSAGQIDLLSVPFGSFILEMKALNLKGIESNTLAVPLHAFPPLWRRTWFAMVASLIMVIGLYVIYRIRLKQLLKQSTRKAQDLQIQNDLLRLEQQALRLQMNPHFIFNALQSIQIRMREGKTAEAETHLRKFGDLMRSLLDQSRRDSISLEDEIQSLNVYLEIERSIRSERFDFSITAPAESDLSFYHIPPMVIQPFVENAVKHGLPVNGSNGDIQIKMRLKGRYLECTVRDNGPGMARATQPVHQSAGIQVTADRLRSLSSSSSMDPVKIETLRNDEMVTGTMVTLSIPIIEEEA